MIKNNVQIIGFLGADPEIFNGEKSKVARFSMAVNNSYKNQDGEIVENTDWFDIVAFGNIVELLTKYLVKGSKVLVNGKLSNNVFVKEDGTKTVKIQIVLSEFLLINGGNPQEIEVITEEN